MRILSTATFEKEAKRLAKKFPSLRDDLAELKQQLLENPTLGASLGRSCYKIRLAVKSKGQGKRGGMRVVTWVMYEIQSGKASFINLISIYDKSEQSSISWKELSVLIEEAKHRLLLEKFGKN